jgi:hypothetical protein
VEGSLVRHYDSLLNCSIVSEERSTSLLVCRDDIWVAVVLTEDCGLNGLLDSASLFRSARSRRFDRLKFLLGPHTKMPVRKDIKLIRVNTDASKFLATWDVNFDHIQFLHFAGLSLKVFIGKASR